MRCDKGKGSEKDSITGFRKPTKIKRLKALGVESWKIEGK